MSMFSRVEELLGKVWDEPLRSELLNKTVDVSAYSGLSDEIPDKTLIIEEVFPRDELEDIWENFKPYLEEYKIFPFLGTLGEAVICIGYGENNLGRVYYFDFDFGCHPFANDSLDEFLSKMKDSSL